MKLIRAAVLAGTLLLVLVATTQAQTVTGLTLINAETDKAIGPLKADQTLDLAKVGGPIAIRADVEGNVRSVRFGLEDVAIYRTESAAPFSLEGDSSGDFNAWQPGNGQYTIRATPFTGPNATGEAGPTHTTTITIINAGSAKGKTAAAALTAVPSASTFPQGQHRVTGELRRWHRVTVVFGGPASSQTADPNPFLDYRLNVTFAQGDRRYVVPGYYAGDGEGGPAGNVWLVHFAPPTTGRWTFTASFRQAPNVVVELDEDAGNPTGFDGVTESFTVSESNATGLDFRAPQRGLLRNHGGHYLSFDNGQIWIKGGPNIPENFLGYSGFVNTPNARHDFAAHRRDWNPGDPDWDQGKGRAIIGALNYIAEQGGNTIYFLPMNIGGDGRDTFPTLTPDIKTRYDNAKLSQWEIVFAHAQSLGIHLHFLLAETERANEQYHDNGQLGPERKLFYRELIARFGHHPALQWNLGEENDYGTVRHRQFAAYIKAVDPYDHPLTTHIHTNQFSRFYDGLVGNGDFDMTSFQATTGGLKLGSDDNVVEHWRRRSHEAGVPWVISIDEPQKIENDVDDERNGYPHGRTNLLWPIYMSGAGGFEWYVQKDGGGHGLDQRLEDFREMEPALQWTAHALEFLHMLPLKQMQPNRGIASSTAVGTTYALVKPGEVYALYNAKGGTFSVDLSQAEGTFDVRWFDPRHGGELQVGTVRQVAGGAKRAIGQAPSSPNRDWAVILCKSAR